MDGFVEIGAFAPGEGDREPLYLQRHRIRGGEQTIRITVPRAPGGAGVDSFLTLIDRQGEDNVVRVERPGWRLCRVGVLELEVPRLGAAQGPMCCIRIPIRTA